MQDPDDAEYPDMPRRALAAMTPDYTMPACDIPAILMAREPGAATDARRKAPPAMEAEVAMALGKNLTMGTEDWLGERSNVTCPDCGGVLWRLKGETPQRFRCHTGHAFTADVLAHAQAEKVEEAMWMAMRVLRERAELSRDLAQNATSAADKDLWQARAQEADANADSLAGGIVKTAQAQVTGSAETGGPPGLATEVGGPVRLAGSSAGEEDADPQACSASRSDTGLPKAKP